MPGDRRQRKERRNSQPNVRRLARGVPRDEKLDEIKEGWKRERPDLELGLTSLLWRIEKAHFLHERRIDAFARSVGLIVGDLLVLLSLRRSGKPYTLRPTDLFKQLLVTSGAMTKRVDRLAELGMVSRLAADGDRRSELVRLTPRGFEVTESSITKIATGLDAIQKTSRLSRKELAELDGYMRRLLEHMEEVTNQIVAETKPG